MTDVEQRLGDLRERLPEPPAGIDLAARALAAHDDGRIARRRHGHHAAGWRGRRAVGAAAVVVALAAAVVAAVLLVVPHGGGDARPPTVPVGDGTVPPAGYRYVSSHGITITVPASWPVGFYPCGNGPDVDSVEVDTGLYPNCPDILAPTAAATIDHVGVYLDSGGTPLAGPVYPFATSTTTTASTVAGVAVTRTEAVYPDGGVSVDVRADDPSFTVGVSAPTEAQVDAILATVRVTPVDHLGCADSFGNNGLSGNPASSAVLPSTVVDVDVCEYLAPEPKESAAGDALVTSRELNSAEIADLITHIRTGTDVSALPTPAPTDPNANPLLRYLVHGADGTTRVVDLVYTGNRLVATDGTHYVELETEQHVWDPPSALDPIH